MKKTYLIIANILALLLVMNASATIITGPLAIDFRSETWAPPEGGNTFEEGPVTVAGITVYPYVDNDPDGIGILYQDPDDGLGIFAGELDEINAGEELEIFFEEPQYLNGFWITDLFDAPDGGAGGESGMVSLFGYNTDGDAWFNTIFFSGSQADQENGELFVSFGEDILLSNAIFAPDDESSGSEFSIAGFTATPVPEPATMLLLGAGLIGIAGARRKFIR